jgi:DNA-binding response OmpR family regulator
LQRVLSACNSLLIFSVGKKLGVNIMFNAPENLRLFRSRIWIADARPADYADLEVAAQRENMHIEFFTSAASLLHFWRSDKPDVCLIGVDLPDLSGLDLADMLRPFPKGTTIGLVANSFDPQTEICALTLGVHCCLCKPLVVNVLCACLPKNHLISRRGNAVKTTCQPLKDDFNDSVCCELLGSGRRRLH